MSIPQSASGPIQSRDDLVRQLSRGCRPKEQWRIGTEHEKFVYDLKTHKPVAYDTRPGIRQLLETDMVYVRDFSSPGKMSAEQWKHLALVAHHCYGSYDLVLKAILALMQLGVLPPDTNRRYLSSLPARKAH